MTNKLIAETYHLTGPGIQVGSDSVTTLEKAISTAIGLLTIFGVIWFIIKAILAGYKMMSSMGDPKEFATSQKRLIDSLIGLAVIVIAYGLGAFITNLLGIENVFDLSTVFKPIN